MKKKFILLIIVISLFVLAFVFSASVFFVPDAVNSVFSHFFGRPLDVARGLSESAEDIESLAASPGRGSGNINGGYIEPVSYMEYADPENVSESEEIRIESDMKRLEGLYRQLNRYFLWDIDYDKVYDAMATAMFETLDDKYSYYIKEENAEDYKEEITGKYGGLGFYFSKTLVAYQEQEKDETLYAHLSQVFPNTPASRGGLLAGDLITHIDGEDVVPLEADDCARRIKGEVGTDVTLTVKRGAHVFDVTMRREMITVPTIEYAMLDGNIGYILILEISKDTVNKVGLALMDLRNQGMESLIIDVRDNPGGDVDTTLNIINFFVSDKDILTIRYKDESQSVTYHATKSTLIPEDIKIAVLINGGTASSAEVLSAALRDNGRATLIGTKSFGKGIMQVIVPYGEGYMSVTTASLIPPSGEEYHKIGLSPDIEVKGITVEEDERDTFNALVKEGVASAFVDSNKDYTRENVERFVSENSGRGVAPDVLRLLIRGEYYRRMTYDERPKVDTWFDPQIRAAVDYLLGR